MQLCSDAEAVATLESEKLCFDASGHSLGGALATLAAFDIRKELLKASRSEVQVLCYSFGAPRTGNHAFAKEYNRMVPDTWAVINDQVSALHSAAAAAAAATAHVNCVPHKLALPAFGC